MKKILLSIFIVISSLGFAFKASALTAPNISYGSATYTLTVGVAFTITPTVLTGNAAPTVTISPALPTGLSISSSTGVISGTPTATLTATNYTITATNTKGTKTFAMTITIVNGPTFTYSPSASYPAGTALSIPIATITNGPLTNATISPALPTGLTISTTGTISGTPIATSNVLYTVTGTIANGGTGTATLTIKIVSPPAPSLAYSPTSYTFTQNTAITTISPSTTTGIAAINFGTGTALPAPTTPAGLNDPGNMTIGPNGYIYVADNGNGKIREYNTAGTFIGNYCTSPANCNPLGIVFDSSGNAYVLDYNNTTGNCQIDKYVAGVFSATISTAFDGDAYDIAIDASNNLYVSDNSDVYKLSTAGTAISTFTIDAGNAYDEGVAVDGSGNIYVVDNLNNAVYKYNSSGTLQTTITTNVNNPSGLYIDGAGNLYIGNSGNADVLVYGSTGLLVTTVTGVTNDQQGIAVDASGNLYVSDSFGTTVTKYPPIGGYYLNTALPPGLLFNTTNGQFSGTPTTAFTSLPFTVTAYNSGGNATATVTFTSNPIPPALSYPSSPYSYAIGAAITITPTSTAGTPTAAVPTPALPTGLTISSTGVITGSSTVAFSGSFTVTPSNSAGTGSVSNSFTINISVTPAFTYPSPFQPITGVASTITPTITAGTPTTWSYTGTMPTGLTLNTSTGVITGTDTYNGNRTIVITGTNAYGISSTYTLVIDKPIATAGFTYVSPGAYTAGTAITALSPSATVTKATVSPGLPAGLSISAGGVITGTPTTVTASATYAVTALIGGVYESAPVTLSVVAPAAPVLTYAGTPYNFTSGVTNTTVPITNTGGTVTSAYTFTLLTGALPAGITFSTSTGTFTCAPTASGAFTGTVNATNYVGVASTTPASISVTVTAAVAPSLSYTPTSYTITYGASVNATISNSGGLVTSAYSYTAQNSLGTTVGLPTGLTFSTTTGAITGVPYATSNSPITITTTGSNSAGTATTNAVLLLTVNPAALTITETGPAETYGTAYTGSTGSTNYTTSALVTGDAVTGVTLTPTVPITSTTAAGTAYSVVPSAATGTGGFSTSNYTITYVPYNGTVSAAALIITANSVNKVFGNTLTTPVPLSTAFTSTGLQNGETIGTVTIAYGTGAAAGAAVGTYTGQVTASSPTGGTFTASNYTITYIAGNINVTVAPPDFSYTPAPTYLVGTAITAITPTTLGGSAVAGLTYTTPGTALTNTNLSGAWGMASDPAGDIYIANYNTGKVTEYGPTGTYLGVVINIGLTNSLASIAIDGSGNIYLGTAGGAIYKYNNLFVAQTYTTSTTPNSAYGMTTDAAGDLYVADEVGGFVDEYSPTGALLLKLSYDAGGASGRIFDPNDVQVDAAGNIYVLDGNYNDITEYTSTGAYLGKPITGLSNFDYNFYIDPSGNFDVSNTGGGNIKIYSSGGGAAITTLTPTSGTKPRGIFVDGSGNLYQVDNTGNVLYKYAPAGGYTLNYVSGTTSLPPGLTFNSTTGAISGTPTIAFTGTYSVTGINAGGSFTCTSFTINCVSKPIIIYTTPDSYLVSGTSIAPITPTNTGSPVSGAGTYVYAITSGAVPSGWTFTAATGVITGTPALADVGTYTITVTATNAYGTSAPFTLTINVVTPPVLTYPTPSYYAVNQAITTLSATNTGGTIPALQTYGTGAVILNSSSNGLNEPMGMAVDVSGNLYVTNFGANSVTEYSTTGTVTTYATGVPNGPVGIVFDSSGNVYVLGQTARDVVRFAGGISGAAAGIITTGLNTPTGISIDASGNLYVANSGTNTIKKYSVSGTTATLTLTYTASNFEDIYGNTLTVTGGVSVDNSGNVWFASYTAGITYLAEFNPAGNELFTAPGLGTTRNYGVYLDGGGNVFLTGTGTNNGEILNGNTLAATADETGFTTPEGIVSDGLGNFYISDYGAGTVTKYSPQMGYYLSGTLPPGLSFNNTNGQITGTPTAAYTGNFTITGYIDGFSATSNTFQINCGYAPIISYITPDDFLINTAITALNPTNVSNPATGTWSVSPALPAGLTLSPSTGVIYGTPTALSPATNYIVSVGNIYGTGGGTLNITVYSAPAFSYVPDPDNLPINVAMASLLPTTAAGVGSPIPNTTTPYNTTGVAFKTGLGANIPWGIASDASGNIYVANNTGNTIIKYSPGGAVMGTYTTTAAVSGVTVDPYGNVYAILTTGYIYKYSTTVFGAGTLLTNAIYLLDYTYNSVSADYGITSDPSGNLYISDATTTPNPGTTSPPAIWKYTLGTGSMAVLVTKGTTGLSKPSGVAVDATGNVYSLDLGTKELVKYNSSGTYVSALPTGLNTPYGLYIDALGHIFIGDSGTSTVKEWNSTGTTVIQAIATGTPASPRGITEDPFYNLYVTDYTNGTVTKYLPNLYEITTAGALPTGLSFNTNTGTFSGTPTVVQGPLTYNIVAYGLGSSSGSSPETFNCYTSFDWIGPITAANTNWNTAANWESLVVPVAGNTANFGVNIAFTNQPTVTANATVGAIQIGNSGGKALTLTVSSGITLTVNTTSGGTGAITKQSDANSLAAFATGSSLAGPGTITAVNLDVIGSTVLTSNYTETFSSAVTSLKLSGTVNLASGFSTNAENATFNVTGGITSVTAALATSNAAGATSTFGVVPTTAGTLQLANSTPLSGLSATGTNVTNFKNAGATIEYSGAAQTFYTDAAVANLSNTVSYQSIKFSGTGVKSPTSGNLNVAGDFTNAMANDATDYVTLTSTPVYFNGAGAQNINAGGGTGTVFNNITFNGSGATTIQSGMAYVDDVGTLTMAGTSTLAAGGFLTLNSDATGTAAIAPITSGTPISGTVNVQRYITGDRSYRLMSSPVSAGTSPNGAASMNYLLNSLYLTGPGTGFTATGNPTLFLYDESFVPQYSTFYNSNYIAVNSMTSGTGTTPTYLMYANGTTAANGLVSASTGYTVPAGNGYYVFYRGNPATEGSTAGVPNVTNPAYTPVLSDVATASGTLNQGQVTFMQWYNPTSTTFGGLSQYWTLIGNPYASAIDLAQVQGTTTSSGIFMTPYNSGTNTGITSFIYELQPANGIYAIYNTAGPSTLHASEFIGSGQGFMIEAYGANSSQVVFNENAKATSTNSSLPQGFMNRRITNLAAINPGVPNPILRLRMTKDSINDEETIITFNPKSSSDFVINEDARHWKGEGLIGFTSISSDNVPLAINSLPLAATQTIPLRTVATNDGLYNISLAQQAPLPALYEIWLKDAYMKDSLDIKDNPSYNFDIAHADTASYGDYRFSLVIRQNAALMVHLLSFTALKATGGDNVAWTTENEANYTNFAVQRSTDGGTTFGTLGTLASSGLGAYSYLDSKPVQGANSYRLQLTDLNGTVTYSNIITIMYANTGNQIALNGFMVYPNPTAGAFNLSITQPTTNANATASATVSTNYTIQIVNNLGVVLKTAQSSSPQWQTDVSSLNPGTYFITVMNSSTNKVVGKSAFVKL